MTQPDRHARSQAGKISGRLARISQRLVAEQGLDAYQQMQRERRTLLEDAETALHLLHLHDLLDAAETTELQQSIGELLDAEKRLRLRWNAARAIGAIPDAELDATRLDELRGEAASVWGPQPVGDASSAADANHLAQASDASSADPAGTPADPETLPPEQPAEQPPASASASLVDPAPQATPDPAPHPALEPASEEDAQAADAAAADMPETSEPEVQESAAPDAASPELTQPDAAEAGQESSEPQGEPASEQAPAATASNVPQAEAPRDHDADANEAEDFDEGIAELIQDAEELAFAAHRVPALEELKTEIELIAVRACQLRDGTSRVLREDFRREGELRRLFGRLTKLAKEHCTPHRVFVDWLAKDANESFEGDWEDEEARLLGKLEAIEEARAERAEREARKLQEEESRLQEQAKAGRGLLHATRQSPSAAADLKEQQRWQTLFVQAAQRFAKAYTGTSMPEKLLVLLSGHEDVLAGKDFRSLRKQIKRLKKPASSMESKQRDQEAEALIESMEAQLEQPAEHQSRFKQAFASAKAMMIGGSARKDREAALQEYFGFDSFTWFPLPKSGDRQVQQCEERVASGRYDYVFLLAKFCSHKAQRILKRGWKRRPEASGGAFVVVTDGYGVPSFCHALERAAVEPPQEQA